MAAVVETAETAVDAQAETAAVIEMAEAKTSVDVQAEATTAVAETVVAKTAVGVQAEAATAVDAQGRADAATAKAVRRRR